MRTLLAHCRLVCVSGGLIVIRERNDGRAYTKDHGGMDLTMCVRCRVRALEVVDGGGVGC